MHTLVVMHRQILYENLDSAKIKVPFYTTDIDILRVASMHPIVIHCIDISMNPYTPTVYCLSRFNIAKGQKKYTDSESGNDHLCFSGYLAVLLEAVLGFYPLGA